MRHITIILLIFSQQLFSQDKISMAPINSVFVEFLNHTEKSSLNELIPSPVKQNFDALKLSSQNKSIQFAASYDLRTAGSGNSSLLTSVKNQGGCSSCWSFASCGSIESRWKILGLGTFDLSEDNMNNCHGFDVPSCGGGNLDMIASYLVRKSGPVLESEDPYTGSPNACPTGLTEQALISDVRYIPNDASTIKQAILDYGALYTEINIHGTLYGDNTYKYSGSAVVDHAVLLVGWDDNKVTGDGGTGAWICKNSWGAGWGESGFFYVAYSDTKINSNNIGYFPNRTAYNANVSLYSYDYLGSTSHVGYGNTIAYGIVKYTATANQQITKIGIWNGGSNATVDIDIYDDFDGTTLTNLLGTLTAQSCVYPGYYTFNLPYPINISNANDFYIKIKYTTPTYNFPIPVEKAYSGYSSPALETGKCWISNAGSGWQAIGTGTAFLYDLCVNAYAVSNTVMVSTFSGSGNWSDASRWSNGIPSSSVDAIVNGTCTINANAACKNITVNEAKSLSLNSGISINVSGNFLAKSSATGSGLFKNGGGTLNVFGTSTVETYLSANAWHLISSPVTSATAGLFTGMYLKSFNPSTALYNYISSTSQILNQVQGYATKATTNKTISYVGTLNSGNFSPSLLAGWNLVGNPFACNLDWTGITAININAATMYLWNGTTYLTRTIGGVGTATNYIPAGQGFFVQATGSGLSLLASAQTVTAQTFYKTASEEPNDIVYLKATKGTFEHETIIYFDQNATNNYDVSCDANLLSSGNSDVPEIYTTTPESQKLCINTLAALPNNISIPIAIVSGLGEITITASHLENFNVNTNIILEDIVAHQFIDLKENPSYTFTNDPAITNRFLIHFGVQSSIENSEKTEFFVYAVGDAIYVNNASKETGNIEIYNMLGQIVSKEKLGYGVNNLTSKLATASYIVNIQTQTQSIKKKIIIE